MANFFVSPTGSGKMDGSSWADAAKGSSLQSLIAKAGTGSTFYLRADQGSYTLVSAVNIATGGSAGTPMVIKGVDGAGQAMNATFVSDRAAVFSTTAPQGIEAFRLLDGANHIRFENLSFQNVNNAFRLAGNIQNITIEHATATNVSRFVDNLVTGSATSATVSGLTIRDVDVVGFAKGAIRLQYNTNTVLIEDVHGDGKQIDGANLAIAVALDGTGHDVVIRATSMANIKDSVKRYWNGAGFSTGRGVHHAPFENTRA